MIEQEYRAWHKQEQKMYQVSAMYLKNELYGIQGHEIELYGKPLAIAFTLGKDVEIMQFIGIKDKNGKKIFKGDILRLGYSDGSFYEKPVEVKYGLHQVGYDSDAATVGSALGFYFSPYPDHEWSGIGAAFNWDDAEYSEIIGNVYEHPGLLKGKT